MKAEGKGAEFEQKYLDLLAAADTEHHSRMLTERFGPEFDLTKREFWQGGLDVYKGMIDELDTLVRQQQNATPECTVSTDIADTHGIVTAKRAKTRDD